MYALIYIHVYVWVCLCVCIYIFMCVCVCVYVHCAVNSPLHRSLVSMSSSSTHSNDSFTVKLTTYVTLQGKGKGSGAVSDSALQIYVK